MAIVYWLVFNANVDAEVSHPVADFDAYGAFVLLLLPARRNHFEKWEGIKSGGMFKSPMAIMLVITAVLMVFLPKMMENLDPEQLEVSFRQTSPMTLDSCCSQA